MDTYDVVVVGGGAAGLSAAVALARSRRSVLVGDAGQPRNAPAHGVHNLQGQEGRPPAELLATGRDELRAYGGSIVAATAVGARRDHDGGFAVGLGDDSTVRGRRLLVATGLVDELPDVPGVAELWGTDVHGALLWRQLTDDVTVFLPSAGSLPDDALERLAARDIAEVSGEVSSLELTAGRLSGVRLADGRVVTREVLVVAPRFTARSAVLAGRTTTALPSGCGADVRTTRSSASFRTCLRARRSTSAAVRAATRSGSPCAAGR